ncbi:MAG: hypothetical protein VKI83_02280 [Synechococcaceae cyanobacterium]|nr:hypothetical protein [Synechococcaceae cyanobacterium]
MRTLPRWVSHRLPRWVRQLAVKAPAPIAALPLAAVLLLAAGPSRAGEATARSALGQEDALQQALEQMPAGNAMNDYRCEEVVQPLISSLYSCTVQWGPLPR